MVGMADNGSTSTPDRLATSPALGPPTLPRRERFFPGYGQAESPPSLEGYFLDDPHTFSNPGLRGLMHLLDHYII